VLLATTEFPTQIVSNQFREVPASQLGSAGTAVKRSHNAWAASITNLAGANCERFTHQDFATAHLRIARYSTAVRNQAGLWGKCKRILNHMPASLQWLLWAPLGTTCLHVFEEFVWPGGFPRWYRRYRVNTKSVTRRFLVIINTGLLVTLLEGAMAGNTPFGVVLLLTFSGILFSNGCWHLWASYNSRTYSPGTISGTLLYLPLPLFEYWGWIRVGRTSLWTAGAALLIGTSYPLWSALYHRRPGNEPDSTG